MKIVRRKARRLNELALFAGAGGGILASRLLGHRVVCAVEIDPYCREVLLRRQEEGYLDPFPIWDDARSFDGGPWRGVVDVVSAGFPCQPFSVAGKRAGACDERNLWPEAIRIIREVEPRFAFLENVPGLLGPIQDKETGETQASYFGTILRDLAESGYDARWDCVSAAACSAPHQRNRLWIIAVAQHTDPDGVRSHQAEEYDGSPKPANQQGSISRPIRRVLSDAECTELRNESGRSRRARRKSTAEPRDDGAEGVMADSQTVQRQAVERSEPNGVLSADVPDAAGADGTRRNRKREQKQMQLRRSSWWTTEPAVGRVAHGVAHRVNRLKALGNGQVPAVARAAWELLTNG